MSISAHIVGRPHRSGEMTRFYRRLGGHDEVLIEMVRMAPTYLPLIDAEQEMEDRRLHPITRPFFSAAISLTGYGSKLALANCCMPLLLNCLIVGESGDGEMSWVKIAQMESVPLVVRGRGLPACVLEHGTHHCCRELQCPEVRPLIRFYSLKRGGLNETECVRASALGLLDLEVEGTRYF